MNMYQVNTQITFALHTESRDLLISAFGIFKGTRPLKVGESREQSDRTCLRVESIENLEIISDGF